jgi:hypothetical protein
MNITIEASFYGYKATIQDQRNLCDFGSLTYSTTDEEADPYQTACPLKKGNYELFTSFTVPRFWRDQELDFTPDLYLEFVAAEDGRQVGCAETGTLATTNRNRRRSIIGMRALWISFFVFGLVFSICLVGHRRKKRMGDKSASVIRRYHYRKTTRNGTVLVPNLSDDNISNKSGVSPKDSLREVS